MQRLLDTYWPYCKAVDEETLQLGEALWAYYSPSTVPGAVMQHMRSLMIKSDPELGDMIVLKELEIGPCDVIHADKRQPTGTVDFRRTAAKLEPCKCGKLKIVCGNPKVQQCCGE